MATARKKHISLTDIKYYHCISRCVRRAFLCGEDKFTGKSYDHRWDWVEEKLLMLGSVFCIDVRAYAVMSNHTHIVLYVDDKLRKIIMKVRYALLPLMLVSSLCSADTLSDKVNAYFDAQKAVEHHYSKESDVTHLLTLLTPDTSFEHPRFNAVLSKEEYKKGLLSYLGQYGKCDIEVTNIIEGLNAVTVEYLHPCVDQQGNTDEKENKQKLMTLFEFSGEKIKRIRHYF